MRKLLILLFLAGLAVALDSCKKKTEPIPPDNEINDVKLYDLTQTSNFTFYQNSSNRLPAATASPHENYIRVSFNDVAQNALGPDGKLPMGNTFPDSSIIIKEVFDSQSSSLDLYAVMMKRPNHPNEGGGWLWAEYDPGGGVIISLTDNGDDCVSCHNSGSHRDLVRTFEFH